MQLRIDIDEVTGVATVTLYERRDPSSGRAAEVWQPPDGDLYGRAGGYAQVLAGAEAPISYRTTEEKLANLLRVEWEGMRI